MPDPILNGGANAVSIDHLPGPKGLPLVGNVHQLDLKRLHQVLEGWEREFGSVFRIRLGAQPVVVISDAALIMQILRERPDNFRRFRAIESVFDDMGLPSLFSVEGKDWQRQRRVWMQALNAHQVKPFFAELSGLTRILLKRWQQAALSGEAVDVQRDLVAFTFDAMLRFAFGYESTTLERGDDEIQGQIKRSLDRVGRRVNAPFPYWRWFKLPGDRLLDREVASLRDFAGQRIEAARKRMAIDPELASKPANLIEALLAARDEDGSSFTDNEIFGAALSALGAGVDTTANTIAWMLWFLSQDAALQSRLQNEVDAVLGSDVLWTDLDAAERLDYIDGLMAEAMRLKPVAPIFFMCANKDVTLGSLSLPAGTDLMLLLRPAAISPDEFSAPADCKPERWREPGQSMFARRPPTPFGSGPRMCPGRNLAQIEIKSVVAMLARNFTVTQVDGPAPVVEEFGFSMMPVNLRVRFSRRS